MPVRANPTSNRRQRRRAKQKREDGVRWRGHCRCDCCTDAAGKPNRLWPHVYVGSAGLSWDCYLEINAPPERSPSVVAFEWLAGEHAAGVDVGLAEIDLRSEDVAEEVHRLESLRAYLARAGEADPAARERRYLEIVEMWSGRRHRRRLRQWLWAEFPGWTMNGDGHDTDK